MAKGIKTGGRQMGSKNKATALKEAAIAESGLTPLEFLLQVMRKPIPSKVTADVKLAMMQLKFEAAKAAAPYVHPRAGGAPSIPPGASIFNGDDDVLELNYEVARRIAFALDVTPPKNSNGGKPAD